MEGKEYKIGSLLDIVSLEEDQIDRLCAELPVVIKQVKALNRLVELAVGVGHADDELFKILNPLTWIDDGKNEITITARCADGESVVARVSQEPQLSDLEIVQKALDQSKLVDHRCASLDFEGDGDWIVWQYSESAAHQFASGNGRESLLTWAKQTIGVE